MCREKALAMCLFDAVTSAANRRSGHTEAFVHNHSRPWTSTPCLTLTGTSGAGLCSCSGLHASTFLSSLPSVRLCFPHLSRLSPLRYYGDSDSCTAHLPCRSPRLLRHTFAVVPSPTTWAAWTSLPPRQRVQRVSDFAMNEQARRSSPPNRVRSPTDRQFASGCSPRCFGPTQLPSTTEFVAYSDTDFHRADVAPSRAHSFPHALSGNPGGTGAGPPIKAFGGDALL